MAASFKTVVGNTAPTFVITCTRDGSAIDLTGATVTLILKKSGGSITNTGHQTCTLVTAASGVISYTATSVDFPNAGRYIGDVRVVYSGGGIEILYQQARWVARAANS